MRQAYAQLEQRVEERTLALRKEIIERERMQDQLKHQVMHDSLTGLPNRGYLRDRIDRDAGGICGSIRSAIAPCCTWTSTASRSSTTASAILPATRC